MTTSDPNPDANPTGTEVDEPPRSDPPRSPTPHPGEPDSRPTSAIRNPSDEEIQEGNASLKVGP
jgi:hypothetical protein